MRSRSRSCVQDADKFKAQQKLEKQIRKARRKGMSTEQVEKNIMSPGRYADRDEHVDFSDQVAIIHAAQMLYQQYVSA
jgi:hypothetical protein